MTLIYLDKQSLGNRLVEFFLEETTNRIWVHGYHNGWIRVKEDMSSKKIAELWAEQWLKGQI